MDLNTPLSRYFEYLRNRFDLGKRSFNRAIMATAEHLRDAARATGARNLPESLTDRI